MASVDAVSGRCTQFPTSAANASRLVEKKEGEEEGMARELKALREENERLRAALLAAEP